MNAAETITAAIEKLEGLVKATSTYEVQGDWLVDNVGHHTCGGGTAESSGMHEPGCGYEPLTNDPIVVTLHRTIDAQLDFLRTTRGLAGAQIQGELAELVIGHGEQFAHSVLGDVTS